MPAYQHACERGLRRHREMLGARIVEQARVHWPQREWRGLLGAAACLLRFHPHAVAEQLGRKLRLEARRTLGAMHRD
jgi:hypothetical protein